MLTDLATSSTFNGLAVPPVTQRPYTRAMSDRWETLRRAVVAERDARGLSQEDLAAAAGMTRAALSNFETGKTRDPRGDTLQRIAKALGWTADYLAALARGEQPARSPSSQDLVVARRHLPGAPPEVLRDYALKLADYERLTDEIGEIEARYPRRPGPASPRPRGAS